MLNPSNLFDLNIGCALSHRRFIRSGDAWVGITAKPIAVAALKAFDPVRYGSLAFANPLPLTGSAPLHDHPGRRRPAGAAFAQHRGWPDLDINGQVGAWVRSGAESNPLVGGRERRRRSLVEHAYCFGHSQTGRYLVTTSTRATREWSPTTAADPRPLHRRGRRRRLRRRRSEESVRARAARDGPATPDPGRRRPRDADHVAVRLRCSASARGGPTATHVSVASATTRWPAPATRRPTRSTKAGTSDTGSCAWV
jgi:hypothetical protein